MVRPQFKAILDLAESHLLGPIDNLNKKSTTYKTPFVALHKEISKLASIDTGMLHVDHSGLVSYRADLGHEQLIIQIDAGIYTMKWGQYEGDARAKLYSLAMPYRVIISDFVNGQFVGSRHFFAMTPIHDWDMPLYATGFSNTNNLGYGDTSIGWICHYHDHAGNNLKDISAKIDYVVARETGLGEPYNYGNMSGTDGPTFYRAYMPKKTHFHSAQNWHDKSAKEGMDWVFDESNYIRYYASKDPDSGAKSYMDPNKIKDARAYTLRMAAFEHYLPYYEHSQLKPMNVKKADTYSDLVNAAIGSMLMNLGKSNTLAQFDPAMFISDEQEKLPSTNKFSKEAEAKKDVLKGKPCQCCEKIQPVNTEFTPVVVAFGEDKWHTRVASEWCQHCVEEYAVRMSVPFFGDTKWYNKELLFYDYGYDLYYMPWEAQNCEGCGEVYSPFFVADNDIFLYGANLESPIGCINCVDTDDDYFMDHFNNKLIHKNYLIQRKVLTFKPNTDGPPGLILEPVWVHIDFADSICACGIIPGMGETMSTVEKDGETLLVCKSCTHNPLITVSVNISNEKDS